MFTDIDHHFMQLALEEANTAFSNGDFPVGAILTVDNSLWGAGRNALFSEARTTAHAEHSLISQHSSKLRLLVREKPDAPICLYTTLEPCLMCLGISVMHRIPRIVVACPDPFGGAVLLDPSQLGAVYPRWWPTFETGLYKESSCDLIISFLKTKKMTSWEEMLSMFQALRAGWENDESQF